jgi:hypothetical protein
MALKMPKALARSADSAKVTVSSERAEGASSAPKTPCEARAATRTPKDWAGLGLSSTSAIVGQLSRAGLVARAEDEADRRRTIVRLHEDYQEMIGTWAEQTRAPLRGTLERLSPRARAQFIEGWRILHEEATRSATGEAEDCGA